MLPILPKSAWLEFRGAPNSKTLNEGALHFALVRGPDGKERKCAVKLIDLNTRPGLLCEGLGWMLAQASDVHVPPFAAILRVPVAELARSTTLPAFVSGFSEYPAWCVEVVNGTALAQVSKWLFWFERSRCLLARNTPVIAAFDYWTDNQDRNYGNVIRSVEGRYVAIDHEALLHDELWVKYFGLRFQPNSLLAEARNRLATDKLKRFTCDMASAGAKHQVALQSVTPAGKKFFADIIPDKQFAAQLWTDIESYLESRAATGWLAGELGVIV